MICYRLLRSLSYLTEYSSICRLFHYINLYVKHFSHPCRRLKKTRTAGYKINSHIAKELEITPVQVKVLEYKRYWIQHDRLSRIMKLFLNWQKEPWQAPEDTSKYVGPERVNKRPNSRTDI